MIHIVPTGDLGLDILLGGGCRLITRLPERSSAAVLVRGGAGAGKTLVGLHVALGLAKALGGDVAVGCVEILPSEYVAQLRSARPDLGETSVVTLPGELEDEAGPHVFCGLLTDLDPAAPDLVASLEALGRDVVGAGGRPVVYVVDSLIEGYGIGASASRTSADAVMKFAAQGGCGLVLCEEIQGEGASPWLFAADTVLDLGVDARERGRWIEVRKHRFGPSVSGRHELDLGGGTAPAVYPEPHAWVAPHVQDVLRAHGWERVDGQGTPPLAWRGALKADAIEGAFVLVSGPDANLARAASAGLLPAGNGAGRAMIFELDALVLRAELSCNAALDVLYVPTLHGPARALRGLVERFAQDFARAGGVSDPPASRVILGDLGLVLDGAEALAWVEAVRVFASLVIETGRGVPVIAYATHTGVGTPAVAILGKYADVHMELVGVGAAITERWRNSMRRNVDLTALTALPDGFYRLPRPRGRAADHR